MCQLDPTTEAQLEQTVKQFLDESRMFTGYDVTVETRTRENVQMRHKEVRGGIHELQCLIDAIEWGHTDDQGNDVQWKKTQVSLGSGWAFLYHPETADPNQYQPQGHTASVGRAVGQSPTQPQVAATAVVASVSSSDSGGQNSDGTFTTDYRNRLFVRTEFIKSLDLKANDTVNVVVDQNSNRVLLCKDYPSDMESAFVDPVSNTQQVERDGDLRLSSKTLRMAGLDIAEDFVIENTVFDTGNTKYPVVEIRQV